MSDKVRLVLLARLYTHPRAAGYLHILLKLDYEIYLSFEYSVVVPGNEQGQPQKAITIPIANISENIDVKFN